MTTFTPMVAARFVCELPGCGRATLAWRYSDCQAWLDVDETGQPRRVNLCPEHKATWVRLVSDFLAGDGSTKEIPKPW